MTTVAPRRGQPTAADQPTRRPMTAIVVAAALMNAAMAVASGVGTIVAADRLGLAWGGVAATAGITGTGIGALALTRLTVRRGRGRALALGYLVGAVGAVVATGGAVTDDVAALLVGMLLLGAGNAAAQLSRYAAAELHTEDRRGRAIGAVVWAGAVGAVGARCCSARPGRSPAGWVGCPPRDRSRWRSRSPRWRRWSPAGCRTGRGRPRRPTLHCGHCCAGRRSARRSQCWPPRRW